MRPARHFAAAALLGTLLLSADNPGAQTRGEGEVALRAAMETETVKGDLQSAIEQYRKIAAGSDRSLAARALIRMAECYQKLGDAQARQIFAQVVRDYADQQDAAAIARTRLAALAQQSAPAPSPARRLVVDWRIGPYALPTRDGRSLVRYNAEHRAFELVDIASGQVRPLSTQGPRPDEAAVRVGGHIHLSNDGRRLAAVVGVKTGTTEAPQTERIELRVFDTGGRGEGRTLANWNSADLSRFGVRIFAWSPPDERIWVWIMNRDQTARIAWVDLNGNVQTLKTLKWRDHSQPPSLSPDGRFVAYHDVIDRDARSDIYIIAADGSREHRIEHPANESKPMFVPDGSGVVFESDRRGTRDLWFAPVTDGRAAGTARLMWRDVSPYGQAERFADNGSLFYWFATNDWSTYTVSLDLDATAATLGPPARVAPVLNEVNTGPAYSADGRSLAYFRASGRRIVIRDIASGREREIPFETALGISATADWCATSDVLVASGYANGVGYLAYRVNVNDSSIQRLPMPHAPAFCVGRGDDVIGLRNDPSGAPSHSIVRQSAAGGSETVLFNGGVRVSALARAPDGSRFAFVSHDKDVARLVTMAASSGTVSRDLMATGYFGDRRPLIWAVGWMPDGQRLLVVRYEDDVAGSTEWVQRPLWLWEVPLDGRPARKLAPLPLPRVEGGYFAGIGSFTIHPDGKRLAYHSHEGYVEQTWAIDNLAQFIKTSAAP